MYLLFYTDNLPENSNGCANAFIIRIRPSCKGDEGLLAHERVHVSQWWRTLGLHSLLYLVSKRYRLRAEVEAYRKQLEYPHPRYSQDQLRELYAGWLSAPGWVEGYDLQDICTKEQAFAYLS